MSAQQDAPLGQRSKADPAVSPDQETKKALALKVAIEELENLSIGVVEKFDSYDSLEAGCLSCSGVKIDEQ